MNLSFIKDAILSGAGSFSSVVFVQQCSHLRLVKRNFYLFEIFVSDESFSLFKILFWSEDATYAASQITVGTFLYFPNIHINTGIDVGSADKSFIVVALNSLPAKLENQIVVYKRIRELEDWITTSSFRYTR